ncbi:gas vesicle protein GvpK [Streptomyces sp. NPDC051954]
MTPRSRLDLEPDTVERDHDRMTELRERYGLRPEDLNLDLGPLGPLLPRD